jgi:hypothetical protein
LLWIFRPGTDEEPRLHERGTHADQLFDVTELGLL